MKRVQMYVDYKGNPIRMYAKCATGKNRFKGLYLWQEVRRTMFGFFVKTKTEPFWSNDYGMIYLGYGKFFGKIPTDNPNICK